MFQLIPKVDTETKKFVLNTGCKGRCTYRKLCGRDQTMKLNNFYYVANGGKREKIDLPYLIRDQLTDFVWEVKIIFSFATIRSMGKFVQFHGLSTPAKFWLHRPLHPVFENFRTIHFIDRPIFYNLKVIGYFCGKTYKDELLARNFIALASVTLYAV